MVRKLHILKKLCPNCGERLYNKICHKFTSIVCQKCNTFHKDISGYKDYTVKMDNSNRKKRYRKTKQVDVDFMRRLLENA